MTECNNSPRSLILIGIVYHRVNNPELNKIRREKTHNSVGFPEEYTKYRMVRLKGLFSSTPETNRAAEKENKTKSANTGAVRVMD